MKIKHSKPLFLIMIGALLSFASCKKDTSVTSDQASLSSEAIAIASTSSITGDVSTTDSVYVVEGCKRGNDKKEVAQASLSAAITTYLTTNYAGYTFKKAFSITNKTTNTLDSYIVAILFNSNPVAIKFDASGNFVKVMELKEGLDFEPGDDKGPHLGKKDKDKHGNQGRHLGDMFGHRDGKHRDTIAVSALPAIIKLYFVANYSADTLAHAEKNRDSSTVVISKNNGLYVTIFNKNGVFIRRDKLPAPKGREEEVALTSLPASAQTYLTETYPAYVFKKAFTVKKAGVNLGYLVFIDANLTKYAVQFDASGKFITAVAVR